MPNQNTNAPLPKVSVLTPIFNVERFLRVCLDSLLAQTLQDIEFICINDGSTDSSGEILEEYAAKDPRVVVINKANSGYGDSMNKGLERARGQYVGIVESDDFVSEECFERMYELAVRNDFPDVVKANYYIFSEDEGERFVQNYGWGLCDRVIRPGEDNITNVLLGTPTIWSAIYNREYLMERNIRFVPSPGASFQDTGFVYKSFLAADRIVLCHDGYLRYRVDNEGSSVKSPSKVYCVCDEFQSIEEFLDALPERKQLLQGLVERGKLKTYAWNLDRLSHEYRREFVERMASEFAADEQSGRLDWSLLSKPEREQLEEIMHNTQVYANRQVVRDYDCEQPLVSVVLPVHNAESWIGDVLDYLACQTLIDIQIVCVDDASTDATASILETHSWSDHRIQIVRQPICDAAFARARGIGEAEGTYVWILEQGTDAPLAFLQEAVECLQEADADLLLLTNAGDEPCRLVTVGDDEVSSVNSIEERDAIDEVDDIFAAFVPSLANKVVRRSLLVDAGLDYVCPRHSTTALLSASILLKAKRIAALEVDFASNRAASAELGASELRKSLHEELPRLRERLREWGLYRRRRRDLLNLSLRQSVRYLRTADSSRIRAVQHELGSGLLAELGVRDMLREEAYDPSLLDELWAMMAVTPMQLRWAEFKRSLGLMGSGEQKGSADDE